jgi:hypothetical protein
MRAACLAILLLIANGLSGPNFAFARDKSYEGSWHTTNRKLDGTMQCDVKQVASETWQGRFHGVWQGVPFDYTVSFTGPAADVRGTATIDGATYNWTGTLSESTFKGRFTGSRYAGHFDLEEKRATTIRR